MADKTSGSETGDLLDSVAAGHPDRPLIYSSEQIQARRRRILKETRAMIGADGIDGFSIRKLCQRADVAQRTVYNAFQSKDRMIAIAIQEAFLDLHRYVTYKTSADTLDGMINRVIEVNRRNFKARNYTQAVAAIYFSANASEDIWKALQGMAFLNLRRWFSRLEADGMFEPWIVPDELASDFANFEYAIINDWAQGRIADEDYLRRLVEGFLRLTLGATRGEVHQEARRHLEEIRRTGRIPEFPAGIWRRPDGDADDADAA